MGIINIKLPQQGASMTDGDISEWFVETGDNVEKGQEIVEIEIAKTSFPVTAPATGTIKSIEKKADDNVKVGEVIATIETET